MVLTFGNTVPERHYIWNSELWKALPQTLGISKGELADRIGIPRVTLWNWFNDANCEVRALIWVCNTFQIRVSTFITLDNARAEIPKTWQYKDNQQWHFRFMPEELRKHFGNDGISWRRAAQITQHNRETLQRWCSERMHINEFIYLCNTFWINAGDVISDSTLQRLPRADMGYHELKAELIELRKQLEDATAQKETTGYPTDNHEKEKK